MNVDVNCVFVMSYHGCVLLSFPPLWIHIWAAVEMQRVSASARNLIKFNLKGKTGAHN